MKDIVLTAVRSAVLTFALGLLTTSVCAQDSTRIVSLGGPVTEIVFALGAGDHLVGRDASSVYPEAARELPSVGFFRRVPAEGILSLSPTLVLASGDTGPQATLNQIRNAGVQVESLPAEASVQGAKEKIRAVARVLERQARADSLIQDMERELAEARALRERATGTPRVLFVFGRGSGTTMVGGEETRAEAMIELAGGMNAAQGFTGYKPMSTEAVVAAEPDVILVMEHGLENVGGVKGMMEQPGVKLTPAGKNRRIVVMSDLMLLGFTPRLGVAVEMLMRKLHPELKGAPSAEE